MGLPKQLDILVRGADEFSFILANIFAEQKKKVLIVDESADYNSHHFVKINYFEKRFFEELGKKFNIETLFNIEKSLIPLNMACVAQEKIISLVSTPRQNALEFKRKFFIDHEFFGETQFDALFFESIEEFFQMMFKDKNSLKFSFKENKMPLSFAKLLGDHLERQFPSFDFFLRFPFDEKDNSDLHSFYSMFSLLGPNYFYRPYDLCQKLLDELLIKGGYFKQTKIDKIHQDKKEWIVELESFEGLIYPQSIYGGNDLFYPSLAKDATFFSSWEIPFKLTSKIPWDLIILPQVKLQGSFVPYAQLLRTSSENDWIWQCYFKCPELTTDEQILLFLEKSMHSTLSHLSFFGPLNKLGSFKRNKRDHYLLHPSAFFKTGIFSSLLRLRSVIM